MTQEDIGDAALIVTTNSPGTTRNCQGYGTERQSAEAHCRLAAVAIESDINKDIFNMILRSSISSLEREVRHGRSDTQ